MTSDRQRVVDIKCWQNVSNSVPTVKVKLCFIQLFLFQGGEEIVKFLPDVLDSLFAMFVTEDGNSTPHSGQVILSCDWSVCGNTELRLI